MSATLQSYIAQAAALIPGVTEKQADDFLSTPEAQSAIMAGSVSCIMNLPFFETRIASISASVSRDVHARILFNAIAVGVGVYVADTYTKSSDTAVKKKVVEKLRR